MDTTAVFWVAVAVVIVPLLWWWNDYWYALPLRLRRSGSGKLPPGYMGLPFIGEMPAFLWYFKFLGRPDEFIDAKCRKYVLLLSLLSSCNICFHNLMVIN